MKHIKLFESYFKDNQSLNPDLIKKVINGLETLAGFMEMDEIKFREDAEGISSDTYANRKYSPEEKYYEIEKEAKSKEEAYKAICEFLNEDPKDIIVFWNNNNIGGEGITNEQEVRDEHGKILYYTNSDNSELQHWFKSSIDKFFGRHIDINAFYGPQPKPYLGSPIKKIEIKEEGVYFHEISMWISPDGLKFVSWGWEQGIDWMCSRTLIESAFSSLLK